MVNNSFFQFSILAVAKAAKDYFDTQDGEYSFFTAVDVSGTLEFWVYKMESLVRFMQNHAKTMKDNPNMIKKNIFQHYNKNTKDIKQKTLYLVKEEVAPNINTEAKIKKIYPYKVKFVTREEIEEAITNHDEDVVFLHKVGPQGTRLRARCYKIIIGAKDANFYFFNYHWVEKGKKFDAILDVDFKKMAKKK